jgi:hypothetical protein
VKLVVAGAKVGLAYICSIKQAHANFSKDYIKEQFKDAPSGQYFTNSLPGHALPPRATRTAPRARDDDDAGDAEALPLHRRHSPRPYVKKNEQPDFDPAKSQGGRRAGPGRSAGDSNKAYRKRCGICARQGLVPQRREDLLLLRPRTLWTCSPPLPRRQWPPQPQLL